jgi:hypothetical protein
MGLGEPAGLRCDGELWLGVLGDVRKEVERAASQPGKPHTGDPMAGWVNLDPVRDPHSSPSRTP